MSENLVPPKDFVSTEDNHQSTEDSVEATADLDQTQIDVNEVEKSKVENEAEALKAKVYHFEEQQEFELNQRKEVFEMEKKTYSIKIG